jgi:YD repeat-containing protein
MVDASGNVLNIARQPNGRIQAIGTAERQVSMSYGGNDFVSEIIDSAGRTQKYTYTPTGRIQDFTDADNRITSFTYVDDNEIPPAPVCAADAPSRGERIKRITYPGRATPTENFYGPSRRVLRQSGHDGREFHFAYKLTGACITHQSTPDTKCTAGCPEVDSWENFQAGWRFHGGRVAETIVHAPDGTSTRYTFNAAGVLTAEVNEAGQPATTRKLDANGRVVESTDLLGRTWKYKYDAVGNVSQETDPLNRITDYIYDLKWNKPLTITRYLDGVPVITQMEYDQGNGQLKVLTDPTDRVTAWTTPPTVSWRS